MADHLSRAGRSRVMSAIRRRDTKPELALRSALRAAGVTGYRVDLPTLPGRPDIAFTRWRVAVFVDGVFWHGHPDHWRPEQAASQYWRDKIARNIERDRAVTMKLKAEGWTVLRFWDLEVMADPQRAVDAVKAALSARHAPPPGVAR